MVSYTILQSNKNPQMKEENYNSSVAVGFAAEAPDKRPRMLFILSAFVWAVPL